MPIFEFFITDKRPTGTQRLGRTYQKVFLPNSGGEAWVRIVESKAHNDLDALDQAGPPRKDEQFMNTHKLGGK